MQIFILIVIGVAGGILAGMGMGGGTLLIPLLTVFGGVAQRQAQGINLLAFLPMAAVALVIHFKNKLIKPKSTLWLIVPACVCSIFGALLASVMQPQVLRIIFGSFIGLLGIILLIEGSLRFEKLF